MLFSFLVSITGNFLVIYVIMTNRVMRTSTNCLIMNLAFCDFLISLLQTPHLIKQLYIGKIWFGGAAGKVLCKSYTFGGSVLLNSSVYSLVAIAIDRFLAVTRPLTHKTTSKLVLKIGILLIWIVSTLLSLRLVISSRIHYGEDVTPNCMYFAQSTKELFTSASCFIGSFVLIAVILHNSLSTLDAQTSRWVFQHSARLGQTHSTKGHTSNDFSRTAVCSLVDAGFCDS